MRFFVGGIGVVCSIGFPGVVVVGSRVGIVGSVDEPWIGDDSGGTFWVDIIIHGSLRVDWLGSVRVCGLGDVLNGWW